MESFYAVLVLCEVKPPINGGFPFNFNFQFQFRLLTHNTNVSTTTTTDSIHTSNATPFCKYSALPIYHGTFSPKSHKGHPLSGLYVEVRGYEFIHELEKVIVFSMSNCVQYRFHSTAMYRESVAPVKQWNRFTAKSVHTKKTWVKCISEMCK